MGAGEAAGLHLRDSMAVLSEELLCRQLQYSEVLGGRSAGVKPIGRYEILEEVGRGAMGVVFKARDSLIGRLIAIKTITTSVADDPGLLERFRTEAKAAGALQHPNIVTIHEMGEADGVPFMAMEYLEGESLDALISRRAPISVAKKIGWLVHACRALPRTLIAQPAEKIGPKKLPAASAPSRALAATPKAASIAFGPVAPAVPAPAPSSLSAANLALAKPAKPPSWQRGVGFATMAVLAGIALEANRLRVHSWAKPWGSHAVFDRGRGRIGRRGGVARAT
jgi:hypothetical protein